MEIIHLNHELSYTLKQDICFALNLKYLKEIWIFNCIQGCQHQFGNKQIKINLISKIIITDLYINNISGLLGLLSSLSLINRKKALHIYSYKGINKYLKLGIKYSQTNFRYNLYFHILKTGLIINHHFYQVYAFTNKLKFEFLIISKEKFGKFKLNKAQYFNIIEGPLYGKLKKRDSLILPDGVILNGQYFTEKNKSGSKMLNINNKYHQRNSFEMSKKCHIINNLL